MPGTKRSRSDSDSGIERPEKRQAVPATTHEAEEDEIILVPHQDGAGAGVFAPRTVFRHGKWVEEWLIDGILDCTVRNGADFYYTVHWIDNTTTEQPSNDLLPGCEPFVTRFHQDHPNKPIPPAAASLQRPPQPMRGRAVSPPASRRPVQERPPTGQAKTSQVIDLLGDDDDSSDDEDSIEEEDNGTQGTAAASSDIFAVGTGLQGHTHSQDQNRARIRLSVPTTTRRDKTRRKPVPRQCALCLEALGVTLEAEEVCRACKFSVHSNCQAMALAGDDKYNRQRRCLNWYVSQA